MKALFDQHPPPWVVDDNREEREGLVTVYDANGGVVICVGDMEDCDWGDILLARLIAAAPDLLSACTSALQDQRLTNRTDTQMRAILSSLAARTTPQGEGE